MEHAPHRDRTLPDIPVVATGPAFPLDTLTADEPRAHALFDAATKGYPRAALKAADAISRRWLAGWSHVHLAEIDAVAARMRRPGAHFLSVNYEWGCTVAVAPSPDGRAARLIRVLDWRTPGLGRYVMAAKVAGARFDFVTLTWPGYTGVLQAVAPGRFAAALNQAPMRPAGGGLYALDWAANRALVWRSPHETPAHLLRDVFETAASYADARRRLIETPVSTPAIFSLAGLAPHETCIIERVEERAEVRDGPGTAANHWQSSLWHGRSRGVDSAGRACQLATVAPDLDPAFPWVTPPVLNPTTRLVMVAEAATGRLVARGYEADGPATSALVLAAQPFRAGSEPERASEGLA